MKILHINSFINGSTGRIMRDLAQISEERGYNSYIAFPDSNTNSNIQQTKVSQIIIGNRISRNINLKLEYFTGLNGMMSINTTRRFLRDLKHLKPDIIHLHNLHNSYINLKMLFTFIKDNSIPVVWTLHDCWAFTGGCPHFSMIKCDKWIHSCHTCPIYKEYPATLYDNTKNLYAYKRENFNGVNSLNIVTPSKWLKKNVENSFLKNYKINVINNGIDLTIFKPRKSCFRDQHNLNQKKIILGVANPWSERKGLGIFLGLAKELPNEYQIVLVGLSEKQLVNLPQNILGFGKISESIKLAEIYSAADLFINPSMEETMGLVTLESIACGTPAIVSNLTGIPEMINDKTGIVVENYSLISFKDAILSEKKFLSEDLLKWATQFNKYLLYEQYLDLYKDIINHKNFDGNE